MNNVVSISAFRDRKKIQKNTNQTQLTIDQRLENIRESIKRINDLMTQLDERNKKGYVENDNKSRNNS
jgi:hypothetical protein